MRERERDEKQVKKQHVAFAFLFSVLVLELAFAFLFLLLVVLRMNGWADARKRAERETARLADELERAVPSPTLGTANPAPGENLAGLDLNKVWLSLSLLFF